MSILPVYTYGQPVLRKRARAIRQVDDDIRRLVDDMFETMHTAGGIGLAANQVGKLARVIVVDISEMEEIKEKPEGSPGKSPIAMVNPLVLSEEGSWEMEEGCLSIPEVRDDVERAETIRVRYKDFDMNDVEMDASGLLARVVLHEIDHLNGVLFIDHLTKVKQKLLRGRLNKVRKGEFEVAYPFVRELVESK